MEDAVTTRLPSGEPSLLVLPFSAIGGVIWGIQSLSVSIKDDKTVVRGGPAHPNRSRVGKNPRTLAEFLVQPVNYDSSNRIVVWPMIQVWIPVSGESPVFLCCGPIPVYGVARNSLKRRRS